MSKDPRFDDVVYMIEANSFEQLYLWKNNNDLPEGHDAKVKWEEDYFGFWKEIGRIDDHPVCVSCFFATLNGKRVVFYEATSRVVDYDMVIKWVKSQCPKGTDKCDAMNFHHCIHAILR